MDLLVEGKKVTIYAAHDQSKVSDPDPLVRWLRNLVESNRQVLVGEHRLRILKVELPAPSCRNALSMVSIKLTLGFRHLPEFDEQENRLQHTELRDRLLVVNLLWDRERRVVDYSSCSYRWVSIELESRRARTLMEALEKTLHQLLRAKKRTEIAILVQRLRDAGSSHTTLKFGPPALPVKKETQEAELVTA